MSQQAPESRSWENVKSVGNDLWGHVQNLWRIGNRRNFIIKDQSNRTIVQVPFSFSVVIGLLMLWRMPLILIAAVALGYFMKYRVMIALKPQLPEG